MMHRDEHEGRRDEDDDRRRRGYGSREGSREHGRSRYESEDDRRERHARGGYRDEEPGGPERRFGEERGRFEEGRRFARDRDEDESRYGRGRSRFAGYPYGYDEDYDRQRGVESRGGYAEREERPYRSYRRTYGSRGGSDWGREGRESGRMFGPTTGGEHGSARGRYGHEREDEDERSHRGRGPKNYARSDERIREDVCERLEDADIDVSDIEVGVRDGEVILEGCVDERWSKREAEDIACSVRGVRDCHNQLRIRRGHAARERGNGRPGQHAGGRP